MSENTGDRAHGRWNCGEGRTVTRRAVTVAPGCDDFFHDDDGSVCRHMKAPTPPAALYVDDVLRERTQFGAETPA